MVKKTKGLNRIEKKIVRILALWNISMSIRRIAKENGLAWATVKKYCEILIRKGALIKGTKWHVWEYKKPRYGINPELLRLIRLKNQGKKEQMESITNPYDQFLIT